MKLFFRESGSGTPLIILHGLFGSSDNWYTLAKTFAQHFHVFLVDQRNHGQSPHSTEFNYQALTEDLDEFVTTHQLERPIILGHSMGGKTAMNFVIKHPDKVSQLVVVDISPKPYPIHHDHILEGLTAINLKSLRSRNEADEILSRHVEEADVRQFLLKNLSRTENGFTWKIYLKGITQNIDAISDGLQYPGTFEGPALFIKGSRSNYCAPGDEETVAQRFPRARWATLNTGHWVQAERPQEFAETVLAFLKP